MSVNDLALAEAVISLDLVANLTDGDEMHRVELERIEATNKEVYATGEKR